VNVLETRASVDRAGEVAAGATAESALQDPQ
jgi:hypothetical protein